MIIVTGGAGFIGSNLVAGLEEKGIRDIVVVDVLGNEDKWRNLAGREIRDIVHPDRIFDYLDTHADAIDMIYHMGAISSTTERDVDLIIDTNFVLSRRLWKWCAKHETRFVYASSAATYGDGNEGFDDFDDVDSLSLLQPLNPYGWSKHLFDRRVARVIKEKLEPIPAQWVGLKFFNVYGPNEYHKEDQCSVICKLFPQAKAGAAARLFKSYHKDYEDGGQLRDFVWVGDCVNVMLWLYDHKDVNGIFNVGSGKARSFRDLAEATYKSAGVTPKINYIEMPESLRPKYQYYTQADTTKLQKAGYNGGFTELEDGVEEYVKKFMDSENKYR